jgi:methyl-accepting chemotaxis protein
VGAIGVAMVVAAFGVAVGVSRGLSHIDESLSGLLENDSVAMELLLNLDRDSYQAQLAVERAIEGGAVDTAAELEGYVENRDQTAERFESYEAISARHEGEEVLWDPYWAARDTWVSASDQLADLAAAGKTVDDPEVAALLAASREAYGPYRDTIDVIVADIYEPIEAAYPDLFSAALTQARFTALGALALGLAAAGGLAFAVFAKIRGRIAVIVERSAQIASGDLAVDIEPTDGNDELAQLERAWSEVVAYLRSMADIVSRVADGDVSFEVEVRSEADEVGRRLSGMVMAIATLVEGNTTLAENALDNANSLNTASDDSARFAAEVATSISGVAESASRQAELSERLAGAVQAIAEHVDGSIEAAHRMLTATDQARVTAGEGAALMSEVDDAMQQVTASFSHVEESVRSLDDQFAQVEEVVELIRSIADQTNLLALNAAIEAARAGELGRGFAVVASEVKTLAEESARSTERIGAIVGAVRTEVSRTVDVTRQGRSEVDRTAEVVGSSGQAFGSIEASIGTVDEHAQRVAGHTDDIRLVASDIESATGELVSISHSTGAAAEEVAAASEESAATAHDIGSSAQGLLGLAGEMREAIGRFTTRS